MISLSNLNLVLQCLYLNFNNYEYLCKFAYTHSLTSFKCEYVRIASVGDGGAAQVAGVVRIARGERVGARGGAREGEGEERRDRDAPSLTRALSSV